MGWEWHDRARDRRGRFADGGKRAQLHVRCTEAQLVRIAARATARKMTISAYVLELVRRDLLGAYYPETVGELCTIGALPRGQERGGEAE